MGDVRLLERTTALAALATAVQDAAAGHGSAVSISGEAGIGKTSVIEAFVEAAADRARFLTGGCDDLLTPRTLGPLRDAAEGSRGPLRAAVNGAGSDTVFSALAAELAGPQPTVLVVEDLHWADEATLDVLAYLARRLGSLPTVLVVSYRADAVSATHPLHRMLGATTVDMDAHRPPTSLRSIVGGSSPALRATGLKAPCRPPARVQCRERPPNQVLPHRARTMTTTRRFRGRESPNSVRWRDRGRWYKARGDSVAGLSDLTGAVAVMKATDDRPKGTRTAGRIPALPVRARPGRRAGRTAARRMGRASSSTPPNRRARRG